ncbi:MAG: ABC-2 type transport system permease protein [Flavobacteriales bacterium]|jgi:ABC-2 type transport system permease protein
MKLNITMIKRLAIKDWELNQKAIAAYVLGGIASMGVLSVPHLYAFYMGSILLLTILIAAGFQIVNATIIQEKKEQTVPFIMSLPVRPIEFALAKMIANIVIFFIPWCVIVVGFTFLILTGPIPDGILIFFYLMAIYLVANYFIVLCVALNTESEGWTIFTMVTVNILINPVIMLLLRSPDIYGTFENDIIAWTNLASYFVLGQLVIIAISIALILFRQSRRVTFI